MTTQVFYYSADWCQPCKTFGPLFDRVINDYNIEVHKINIDGDLSSEQLKRATSFQVFNIPVVVKVENGTAVGRLVGGVGEAELRDFLD